MRLNLSARATAAIAVLAVFTIWITWKAKSLEAGTVSLDRTAKLRGKMAPDFTLRTLDDREVSLADFRGKKTVVVSFWASWCGPCRMEMPVLRSFYQKIHKADSNFEIVTISIDNNRADAEEYATRAKLPFPVLLDVAGKVAAKYGADSIPSMFIIAPDGKVRSTHVGFEQGLNFQLAQELGIKNYSPLAGAPGATGGN